MRKADREIKSRDEIIEIIKNFTSIKVKFFIYKPPIHNSSACSINKAISITGTIVLFWFFTPSVSIVLQNGQPVTTISGRTSRACFALRLLISSYLIGFKFSVIRLVFYLFEYIFYRGNVFLEYMKLRPPTFPRYYGVERQHRIVGYKTLYAVGF